MNVLSLFDGISCGQVALNRAGIKIDNYYASEIDSRAIKITQHNYPNTIRLGNINDWRNWDIDWSSITLLTAGFPCQSWSFAGKGAGINDERGQLVLTLVDIFNHLKTYNPNIKFLFENVMMRKVFRDYLNNLFGVDPIKINSSLVSAQNRERWYWTNINGISQPDDKNLFIKDIIDDDFNNYKFYPDFCLDKINKGLYKYISFYKIETLEQKSRCLTYSGGKGASNAPKIMFGDRMRPLTPLEWERLQTLPDGYTNILESDNQRRSAIGNGWTVDVISYIFGFLPEEYKIKK